MWPAPYLPKVIEEYKRDHERKRGEKDKHVADQREHSRQRDHERKRDSARMFDIVTNNGTRKLDRQLMKMSHSIFKMDFFDFNGGGWNLLYEFVKTGESFQAETLLTIQNEVIKIFDFIDFANV